MSESTTTTTLSAAWKMSAEEIIDGALDQWKHQSMVPQSHVVDLLLDLRALLNV